MPLWGFYFLGFLELTFWNCASLFVWNTWEFCQQSIAWHQQIHEHLNTACPRCVVVIVVVWFFFTFCFLYLSSVFCLCFAHRFSDILAKFFVFLFCVCCTLFFLSLFTLLLLLFVVFDIVVFVTLSHWVCFVYGFSLFSFLIFLVDSKICLTLFDDLFTNSFLFFLSFHLCLLFVCCCCCCL